MNKLIMVSAILVCHSMTSVAETQLTISPSLLHFDYTEFSTTDSVLDRELGWLPGLDARLRHPVSSDWFIAAHTSYYQGMVDYVGQTQSGVPHTTDTDTNLFRIGASIERLIYTKTHLFLSAQSHRWKRDIQDNNNISGIDETYQWMEYSIGLNSDVFVSHQDVINLEAGFLITRNATLDVDLTRANLGSTTLDLGNGSGIRLNLLWQRQYKENARYGLSLFFESWEFGRSNTKQTQDSTTIVFVTEPRSETRNIGLKFNIEYSF